VYLSEELNLVCYFEGLMKNGISPCFLPDFDIVLTFVTIITRLDVELF